MVLMRLCALTASATSLPFWISGTVVRRELEAEVDASRDDFVDRFGRALERNVLRLDTPRHQQPFAAKCEAEPTPAEE